MELDLRLLLTLAICGASLVSAFVIVKTRLGGVIDQLGDVEHRIRALDSRLDALDVAAVVVVARVVYGVHSCTCPSM